MHHALVEIEQLAPQRVEIRVEDAKNLGAELAAQKLRKIAETGRHVGVFGGKQMQKCADAIVALHVKGNGSGKIGFGRGGK